MRAQLYFSLLKLADGGVVLVNEIRGYKFWSELTNWLRENEIRYKVSAVGQGMRVEYKYKVDGRCLNRLNKILASCSPDVE